MMKMTMSLVVATSLLVAGGCSKKKEEGTAQKPAEGSAAMTPPPPKPEPPKPMMGADLATQYKTCIEHLNSGKFDDFRKTCIDDAFVAHDYGDGSTHKADDLVSWFKTMKEGMPDWKLSPQLVLVSGRNILAVNLMTGTHTGTMKSPMGDMPATNKKVGMMFFHRLAINDANKATEEWAYSDPATMMGQLGMAPKDAPPTRAAIDKGMDTVVVVTADDAKEKANLEATQKAIDAVNARKFADALAAFAPDAVESDQTADKDLKGTKEMEASIKMWFGAFPDAKVGIDNKYAAGDYVVHMGKFQGTHEKDLGKLKKTGKKVDIDYTEVFQLKDGKITNVWRFHSGMQFAMQLGLMPPPGAPPAAGSAAPPAGDKKPEPKQDEKK